jgi:serine/threonine-protein kinase HipA
MPRTLDVYLHRHLIGKLVQNDHGHMVFDYVESWLTHPTAIPLSQSLPLTKKHSTPVIDLQALLDAVIFNWLIGNNDAHGKNFSFIYRGEISSGLQTRLAPLYDLISTVYYPELSPKMAMKLGGEYDSERITPASFERLAEEAGLAKPMMQRRVLELAEAVVTKLPTVTTGQPVTVAVAKLIQSRCERKIKGFKA